MSVIEEFGPVKGVLQENYYLKSYFGTSAPVSVYFEPADVDDLITFLHNVPQGTKIFPLGALSNVLIRSGGIDGVVIVLGEWFKKIFITENIFEIGAGVSCPILARTAADHELGGLEFLAGIPGTMGGALKMNAGCYSSEISNVLVECEGVSFDGIVRWFKVEDIEADYRHLNIPDDIIITRLWLRGIPNVNYPVHRKIQELLNKRQMSQPLDKRSCGSAFKNPNGMKAWQLIEKAGCRGFKVGDAEISEKHCNFIVNNGHATADDIENLGEQVIQKVFEKTGIKLEWEIIRLGHKA